MRKRRLATVIIDGQTENLEREAEFWSATLGSRASAPNAEGRYIDLPGDPAEPHVLLQKVDHASRIHIDIETDDIGAEVERLQGLGASVVEGMPRWTIMQAPSGHRLCVIGPRRDGFDDKAKVWD